MRKSKSLLKSIALLCVALEFSSGGAQASDPSHIATGVTSKSPNAQASRSSTSAHPVPLAAVASIAAAAVATRVAPQGVLGESTPDSLPTSADVDSTELCRAVHFAAYSTLPSGQKVKESLIWDDRSKTYLVRGPLLAMMLDDPGVSNIPSDADAARTVFRISVRAQPSRPIDRFCQYNFQEMATCDAHGDIIYTQLYTDCDLQTLRHVVMITPDQAGKLPLLALRFQDVRGMYSDPVLYLAADSDLRTNGRSAR
jgi:hypothetical protein